MQIQKNPFTNKGEKVDPVVWEQGCLEEVCGSCSMLINGRPRQACTALDRPHTPRTESGTITVAPLTKFPLVRDLIVDRSSMFENLKKVHAWIEVDGAYDRGPGPKVSPQTPRDSIYSQHLHDLRLLHRILSPGRMLTSKFVGPQIMSQVRLFNAHPTGRMQAAKRLHPLMEEGGINDCGNAQNCVRVCPKNIPLTDAIAAIGRDVTLQAFKDLFSFPDREG